MFLRRPPTFLFLLLALILLCSTAARADTFTPGVFVSYGQDFWSDDATANALLMNNYDSVYSSNFGVIEVGIPGAAGFSIRFTSAGAVSEYLPAGGPIGPLDADLINPDMTASGGFGGDVLGLKLNIDFSAAGLLGPGTLGLHFGDLIITGFDGTSLAGLDGMTISQILALDNIALGGGSAGFSIGDLDMLTVGLENSFGAGGVSTFTDDHLELPANPTPTPEPSSVLLLACGLLALGMVGYWRRREVNLSDAAFQPKGN